MKAPQSPPRPQASARIQVLSASDTLGARVSGIDLSQPLTDTDFAVVLRALGEHGVLCFPGQPIGPQALRRFSMRFGT